MKILMDIKEYEELQQLNAINIVAFERLVGKNALLSDNWTSSDLRKALYDN